MPSERAYRTEVKPVVVYLSKLLERVNSGRMRVPRFQRPFVWRHDDMKSLLDSVLHGYPIGSILVWETDRVISSLERVGPIQVGPAPGGVVSYILDGHQRISTLLGTLMLPKVSQPFENDVDWKFYFDLKRFEFVHKPRTGLKPFHFPVSSLLTTSDYLEAAGRFKDQVEDPAEAQSLFTAADELTSAFRNYQLPVISISEADLDSAVTVFARLNRRGRKMTADQMVSALTYREGAFHLADQLDDLQQELAHRGFANLNRVFLLRSVLAAMGMDIYARDFAAILVRKEIIERLPESFETVKKNVIRALSFLREVGVTSDRLLPYGLQLVFLAEFFRLQPDPPMSTLALLQRWFWVTSFTGWFGGVTSTLAHQALEEIRELARGEKTKLDVVDLEQPAQAFPKRFDGRSARVRAFLLFLTSLNPRSVSGANALDPAALLSELGSNAVGHVIQPWTEPELARSPANRMFTDRDHVGQVIPVIEQLAKSSSGELEELLLSHGFPTHVIEMLVSGDRAGVIRSRLESLIEGERCFMSERLVNYPTETYGSTVPDSDVNDDD